MTILTLLAGEDEAELSDAGESLATIVERADDFDLPAPLVGLLLALDEAIADALGRSQNGAAVR